MLPKQSAGGRARAAALTPARRSEIARNAGIAAHAPKQALNTGKLEEFNDMECAVLEGEIRVLSQRALLRAFGRKQAGGLNLVAPNIAAYLSVKAQRDLAKPIEYIMPRGGRAKGVPAYLLVEICDAYEQADADGKLRATQRSAARAAHAINTGLKKVAVDALVDEATGYQDHRRANALRDLLKEYVAEVYQPWSEKFPREFFDHIYRLRGWETRPDQKRFKVVGKYINTLIYETMPPEVLPELKKRTPKSEAGNNTKRLWQSLTETTGNSHLDKRIASVIAIMRISDSWSAFETNMAAHDEHAPEVSKGGS